MEKLKELWSSWRGSIGFVSGALVVSTTFFTCTVDPNEEAIKEKALEQIAPKEEPKEDPKAEEPKSEEPKEEPASPEEAKKEEPISE